MFPSNRPPMSPAERRELVQLVAFLFVFVLALGFAGGVDNGSITLPWEAGR